MPTCRDMASLASRRLDGRLPWGARLGVLVHLAFCRLCRRYWRQLGWLHDSAGAAAAAPAVFLKPGDAVRARWKAALKTAGPPPPKAEGKE